MSKKWMQIIEHFHLYLLIPFVILFLTIWWQIQINGCLICSSADESIFYNAIRFIVEDPTQVYSTGLYYLPFFCLIFFFYTLGGSALFSQLFFYTGFILFCISILLVDLILIERKIPLLSRVPYLIFMVLGDHLKVILYYNQSKFYVVFFIVLLCYSSNKQPAWVMHLLFQFVIAIMTHLIFWYLFFIAIQIREKYQQCLRQTIQKITNTLDDYKETGDQNAVLIPKRQDFTQDQRWTILRNGSNLKQLFTPIGMALVFFIMANCLFLIQPVLLSSYYLRVFGGYLSLNYDYAIRVENSIVPFLLYQNQGITIESMWLFLIFAIIVNLWMVIKNVSLIASLGVNCLMLITFDPLLMEMYYIFLFLGMFLWIAHDLWSLNGFFRMYDLFTHLCFIFIILYHWVLGPFRYVLYTLFILQCMSLAFIVKKSQKIKKKMN